MKKYLVRLAAAICAVLMLSSCDPVGTPEDTTNPGSETTKDPQSGTTAPVDKGFDMTGIDIFEYVTVGEYLSQKISFSVYCDDDTLAENMRYYAEQKDYYLKRPTA